MKRKNIFLLILNLILTITVFGQIENPKYLIKEVPYCDIVKIDRTETNTVIYFKYTAPDKYLNGGWVCAGKDFFIRDCETKLKYSLIKANNIPICPERHDFQHQGQILEFNLVFPALPSSTTDIDIIEDEIKGGFNFYKVNLTSQSNFISLKQIKGDAKMREFEAGTSKVILEIPEGNQVKILSFNEFSGYYKIEFNGKTGFVHRLYFDEKSSTPSSSNNILPPKTKIQKEENCDEIKYTSGSSKPSFDNFLKGVRYAIISGGDDKYLSSLEIKSLKRYLQEMGFEQVSIQREIVIDNTNPCEYTVVNMDFENIGNGDYKEFHLYFYGLGNDFKYELTTTKHYNAYGHIALNTSEYFYKVYNAIYSKKKPYFNSNYTIKLPKRLTCWTEFKIKNDFEENGVDQIEGIYENAISDDSHPKYKLALKKIKDKYYLIYLSGATNNGNWEQGEIKATLIPTATPLFYKAKWIMSDKSENDNFYISFAQGRMNVTDDQGDNLYVKMFPSVTDNIATPSDMPVSGTGFALTSNGLIVTNYHVIENAKSINIRGINEDFSRLYSAKVIINDKHNDLAILKIDDYSFTSLGSIPYTIKTIGTNVGENIFVLGYPLRATMGDEVKLTNGIISSKTGFQGDITSYQISAPVQPGNSGGPLFDANGNLIGIVNAKHINAENATYAIKASYLTNMIDLLDYPPTLQTVSSVKAKPLTQQVQMVKKFVYIIEAQ